MSKEYIESLSSYKDKVGISKTRQVSPEYEIGINREIDASADLTIFQRLKPIMNVIITRDLSNLLFVKELIKHKKNIILHVVVSGFGATPLEPYTPHPRAMFNGIQMLLQQGFPKEQMVLRIDPVIPNEQGLRALELVLDIFSKLQIKRCRIRMLKMNKNIIGRVQWTYITTFGHFSNPYWNEVENKVYTTPSQVHMSRVLDVLKKYESLYTFETCMRGIFKDFPGIPELGCVSYRDFQVLGVKDADILKDFEKSTGCACPVNAKELCKINKSLKVQCKLKCVHCIHKTANI